MKIGHVLFEWDDIWMAMLLGLALIIASLAYRIITADHTTVRYYLGPGQAGTVCVIADNPWGPDDSVWCSNDQRLAVEFMKGANEALAKARGESR